MVMVLSARVRASLRIEWCFDLLDVPTEAFDHLPDHMVVTNPNSVAQQLHRQMPVAEMPCDAHHLAVIVRMDLQQLLRLCAHANNAAIIQHQSITITHPHSLRQIDKHVPARFRKQHNATPMPPIMIDQHPIGFIRGIPGSCRHHPLSSHHVTNIPA
jgi:hypothetical protein